MNLHRFDIIAPFRRDSRMPSPAMKTTILYAKSELGGITVRPDSRQVMRKAIEGHPVQVESGNDYLNLYHVFERLQATRKSWANLAVIRRQIGPSRWLMFVLPKSEAAPEVEFEDNYDPKRGRYKRYAEQLAAGEALKFTDKKEAIKARRAWQLYVPIPKRKHLTSNIRRLGKSNAWIALVTERGSNMTAGLSS